MFIFLKILLSLSTIYGIYLANMMCLNSLEEVYGQNIYGALFAGLIISTLIFACAFGLNKYIDEEYK